MTTIELSRLAEEAADRVRRAPSLPVIEAALDIARKAAADGGLADKGRVLSLLSLASEYCDRAQEDELQAESIARVTLLAEQGVTEARVLLPVLVAECSSEAVRLSMKFRMQLLDGAKG